MTHPATTDAGSATSATGHRSRAPLAGALALLSGATRHTDTSASGTPSSAHRVALVALAVPAVALALLATVMLGLFVGADSAFTGYTAAIMQAAFLTGPLAFANAQSRDETRHIAGIVVLVIGFLANSVMGAVFLTALSANSVSTWIAVLAAPIAYALGVGVLYLRESAEELR